jgi:hypothetical protein
MTERVLFIHSSKADPTKSNAIPIVQTDTIIMWAETDPSIEMRSNVILKYFEISGRTNQIKWLVLSAPICAGNGTYTPVYCQVSSI